jgi:hypothetical protein
MNAQKCCWFFTEYQDCNVTYQKRGTKLYSEPALVQSCAELQGSVFVGGLLCTDVSAMMATGPGPEA